MPHDPEQVPWALPASVSSSMKWGGDGTLPPERLEGANETIDEHLLEPAEPTVNVNMY